MYQVGKDLQVSQKLLFFFYLIKVSYPEKRTFNRVISDISVVPKETTRTMSDSIETSSPVESGVVRVVSLGTTEINRGNTN